MWKRLQARTRPIISDPIFVESTLDESTYGSSSTGFGIAKRPEIVPTHSVDWVTKELPEIRDYPTITTTPPTTTTTTITTIFPPRDLQDLPSSSFRSSSSVYSQPSPDHNARFPRYSYNNPQGISYTEEVSPPSSPEYETFSLKKNTQSRYFQNPDISPIDEMSENPQLEASRPASRPFQSNIPSLRREKRRNQGTNAATDSKGVGQDTAGGETRFDRYTGEPTTSDKGGRLGVKPGHFTPPALRSVSAPKSGATASKVQASFSDRLKNLGKNTQTNSAERPEWKGSSGRVSLVAPVQDQPDATPLNIPRKSVTSPPISPIGTPVSTVRTETGSALPPSSSVRRDADHSVQNPDPRSGSSTSALNSFAAAPPASPPRTPETTKVSTTNQQPVSRAQPRHDTAPIDVPSTSNRSKTNSPDAIERNFREAIKGVSISPEQSPPRTINYIPSTAQSNAQSYSNGVLTEPSILNRSRPRIMEPSKTVARKEVGSGVQFNTCSPIFISMREGRRASVLSNMGKLLPLTPAEAASRDLISSLTAQIDGLALRRRNIANSIRQMTELMPTDHILLTEEVRRKREMEKVKIEKLKEEEADVRQLEHDLGLRLHRAYKRREKDAEYEPTAFWVRRATG